MIRRLACCLVVAVFLTGCGDDDTAVGGDDADRQTATSDADRQTATSDADSSTTDIDDGDVTDTGADGDADGLGQDAPDSDASVTEDSTTGSDGGGTVDPDDSDTGHAAEDGGNDGHDAAQAADGEEVSYRDLQARPDDYVGRTVDVVGRVFFDTRCPPPDQGGGGPCTLVGYLAHESVTYMGPGEVKDAFPLARDGSSVSCVDTEGTGACPGWENGQRYRLVADVQHRVLGGRETDEIELEVIQKTIE